MVSSNCTQFSFFLPNDPRFPTLSVYYRVYTEDGAIQSMNPVYTDDPYLGRIPAEHVTPPRTAMSLKRCLAGIENIQDFANAKLYMAASSEGPIEDGCRLPVLAESGPGCTPGEPMVLVADGGGVTSNGSRRSRPAVTSGADLLPRPEGLTPFKTRYSKRRNRLVRDCFFFFFLLALTTNLSTLPSTHAQGASPIQTGRRSQ